MFSLFIKKIKYFFWFYVIRPIKKLWRLYIKNVYIEDNPRNHQAINYCMDIMEDNNRQPSNPIEHWLEMQWEDIYKIETEILLAQGQQNEPYKQCRIEYAAQMLLELSEYMIIKDR